MMQKSLTDRSRGRRVVPAARTSFVEAAKGTVPFSPIQVSGRFSPHAQSVRSPSRLLVVGVASLLVLATLLVFVQTVGHDFVNYDDEDYIYGNPLVQQGLTGRTFVWAFTAIRSSNWHPLTWISHALDCQLFGLWAGGHHLVNVLLQCVNVVLLFYLLHRATRRLWLSGLAAALFAVHPLRVESVAWVAERKDLLSGLFFLLCLTAYANYAKTPFSLRRYLAVVALFTLGLLCKPMLVTLPFVLLLLDYWPLGRMGQGARSREQGAGSREQTAGNKKHETKSEEQQNASDLLLPPPRSPLPAIWARLLAEKVPLVILSALSCGITLVAQRTAMCSADSYPAWQRVGNALVSYTAYLGQFLWPARLAVLYPLSESAGGALEASIAAVSLSVITAAVICARRKYPFLLVGWFWYLGMMVPVIGLVQVGLQAMADRYTYLSLIGPVTAAVLLCASWADRTPRRRRGLTLVAVVGLSTFAVMAWRQTAYWCSSPALWVRAIDCTSDNYVAFYSLGYHAQQQGRLDEAIDDFRQAAAIRPDYDQIHNNLGFILTKQGKLDEALGHLIEAIRLNPQNARAKVNMGNALARVGKLSAAIAQYRAALEVDSSLAEAWNDLGLAQTRLGRTGDAIDDFQKSLQINPRYIDAHNNLGVTLSGLGRTAEAVEQFQEVLQIDPQDVDALWNLGAVSFQQGDVPAALAKWRDVVRQHPDQVQRLERLAWVLATSPRADCRNGAEAVQLAERAAQLSKRQPAVLRTLAAAYAECGRFPDAVQTAREALDKLSTPEADPTRAALRKEIALYAASKPLRQPQ